MRELTFTVYGTPQPQGSTKAFIPKGWNRPIITSANAKNKPWRHEIARTAIAEICSVDFKPLMDHEPVSLRADFYFDRPKSVKAEHKTTTPDCDKLVRSLGDALTGIVYRDDAQIMFIEVSKRFGSPARVEIRIGEFPLGAV